MSDSNLVNYYRLMMPKNGRICLEAISKNICEIDYCFDDRLKSFFDKGTKYYVKPIHRGSQEDSAEVLLSKIYQKAGFDCATYIPAYSKYDDNYYVISNNIKTKNSLTQSQFNKPIIKHGGEGKHFFVHDSYGQKIEPSQFFTLDTIRQIIKMRLFDVAFYNIDRNNTNFYYNIENKVATGVQIFDNSMSANYEDIIKSDCDFYHDFCAQSSTRNGIIEFLKSNESTPNFITNEDMTKELLKLNVKETCEEIGDEIGFKIDRQYRDAISDSVQSCAQALSK